LVFQVISFLQVFWPRLVWISHQSHACYMYGEEILKWDVFLPYTHCVQLINGQNVVWLLEI
jgi:hypothetical protein